MQFDDSSLDLDAHRQPFIAVQQDQKTLYFLPFNLRFKWCKRFQLWLVAAVRLLWRSRSRCRSGSGGGLRCRLSGRRGITAKFLEVGVTHIELLEYIGR